MSNHVYEPDFLKQLGKKYFGKMIDTTLLFMTV